MNFDAILRLLGGNNIDRVGTALGAPELGWSERANNNRPTVNTGVTPQSKAAGLDDWKRVHFDESTGNPNYRPPAGAPTNDPNATNRALTGGGGAAPTGGGDMGGGVDELALAEAARRNRISSYKAQAGNIRGQAQGAFDNILKAVNAFRERAKTQFDTAGQEITNNASEILGSNARTATEAAGSARARGRAMGLGDSSKFQLQNKVQGNLASTQGNTIARRGEEEANNRGVFQERTDQAQGQENEANSYLKNAMDRATTVENTGYDAGEEVFTSALNDIVNYQRQLAALKPVQAEGLQQYAPNFGGIANTINGVLDGLGGGRGATEEQMGNPVNPTNVFDLLRKRGLVQG